MGRISLGCHHPLLYRERTIWLALGPIQEGIDHVDHVLLNSGTGNALGKMDGMGVQSKGLTVAIVMICECALHVFQGGSVVDRSGAIGIIAKGGLASAPDM